jgi:hypothetical protein
MISSMVEERSWLFRAGLAVALRSTRRRRELSQFRRQRLLALAATVKLPLRQREHVDDVRPPGERLRGLRQHGVPRRTGQDEAPRPGARFSSALIASRISGTCWNSSMSTGPGRHWGKIYRILLGRLTSGFGKAYMAFLGVLRAAAAWAARPEAARRPRVGAVRRVLAYRLDVPLSERQRHAFEGSKSR